MAEDGLCLRTIGEGIRTGIAQDALIYLVGDEDLAGDGIDDDGDGVIERGGVRWKRGEPGGKVHLAEDEAGLGVVGDGFAVSETNEGEACEE